MKWDDYLGCTLGIGFFLMATVSVYAFVFDCEPTNPSMEYQLEKDCFDRTNDNWNSSFPSFPEWCDEHNQGYDRANQLLIDTGRDFAREYAWAMEDAFGFFYQDTSQGHAGAAPENCMSGER